MGEPTILVKRADGTTERVPLSSLHKKKSENIVEEKSENIAEEKSEKKESSILSEPPSFIETSVSLKKDSTPTTSQPVPNIFIQPKKRSEHTPRASETFVQKRPKVSSPSKNTELPVETSPHELSATTPVSDFFVDLAKAHEWKKDDHISPLEEHIDDDLADHREKTALPQHRYEDVQQIVAAVPFSIPSQLHGRLHALIQSRIKDIRSDVQVQTYVMRSIEQGGLGLREQEAQSLVETIHSVLSVRKEKDIPGPRKTIIHTPTPQRPRVEEKNMESSRAPQPARREKTVSFQDIHPPKKQDVAMGPVEEISSMDLINFRRLSEDPHSAVEVLREKIQTIREDSYLEYVKAQDAWFHSPLYAMYLAHLGKALEKQNTLKDVLDADFTSDDISVVSKFSEELRF